ncbi:MAG: autotransporter outer membrane beta-barrel domain-containing protein, partial [Endozoicomonas sp.]
MLVNSQADDAFPIDVSGQIFSDPHIWLQYSDNTAKQKSHHKKPDYKAKNQGYSIGLNNSLANDDSISTGFIYTYVRGDIHRKNDTSKLNTKNNIFGINTLWQEDNFFFLGQIQYSRGKYHGHHSSGKLDYDSYYRGFSLTSGYTYNFGVALQWQPWASFNHYSVKTNDINNPLPPSTVPYWDSPISKNYKIKEAGVGFKLLGNFQINTITLNPELGISGFHNFKDDPIEIIANFGHAGTG